jgi:hypothetical protein
MYLGSFSLLVKIILLNSFFLLFMGLNIIFNSNRNASHLGEKKVATKSSHFIRLSRILNEANNDGSTYNPSYSGSSS